MPKQAIIEIISTNLLGHPAVRAWSTLRPARVEPLWIELLQYRAKSAVYRLQGVAPAAAPVIAKRCRMATAWIERTIYEDVLPHLPVTALHYYGFVEEDGEFGWLFLDDVGGVRYSSLLAEHRALAARWLGLMHSAAVRVPAAMVLPDRGPDHYLAHLRSARRTMLSHIAHPALTPADRAMLEALVSWCDTLEGRWLQLEQCCAAVPSTLVHGDFRPKNVYVRADHRGTGLFAIDWETAGWGVPAADLAPSRGLPGTHQMDLSTYWSTVRECWPGVDLQALERLVAVGWIFRRLAAISWASAGLAYESIKKSIESLRVYHTELAAAIEAAPWTG